MLLWVRQSFESAEPLVASVSFDFLALFGGCEDGVDADVMFQLVLVWIEPFEQWMLTEVLIHPVVQLLDVGDDVHDAAGTQDVGVFGEQRGRDDASFVFARLEVRVREQEKQFRELVFVEEVGQELHTVGTQDADVVVRSRRKVC